MTVSIGDGVDIGNIVTAETDPVTGEIVQTAAGIIINDYEPASPIPQRLRRMVKKPVWLYRSLSTGAQNNGCFVCYVPTGSGRYSAFMFGRSFGQATIELCIGRVYAGVIGTYQHHTEANKSGTWTTVTQDYAPDGSYAHSSTAGNTITFSNVKGHSIVARTILLTNGGYCVVSIDGDFDAAKRLPAFTQEDATNGICRQVDVGRRYINSYQSAAVGDYHIPLATDLSDVNHSVVFEATGTKASQAGGARAFIGGVVGCSSDDVDQTVSSSRVIAHVESVVEYPTGAPAWSSVCAIETSTTGTFEFLGNIHVGGTEVSGVVKLDSLDVSAMTPGSWQSGSQVMISVTATVANTATPGTVVATRTTVYAMSSFNFAQLTVDCRITFAVQKRVASNYVLMIPVCSFDKANNNVLGVPDWDKCKFGNYLSSTGEMSTFDGSSRGKCAAGLITVSSTKHDYILYGALLDGLKGVNGFVRSGDTPVFLSDRTDKIEKIYVCRSTTTFPETFAAGETVASMIGYGIVYGSIPQ